MTRECDTFQLMDEAAAHRDQRWRRRLRKKAELYEKAAEIQHPEVGKAYRQFAVELRAVATSEL